MKKLLTIAFALLLGASLSFAQATGGSTGSTDKTASTDSSTKGGTKKSGKKGGTKKSKKNSGGTTTPPPK
jgi:hypothetical protein